MANRRVNVRGITTQRWPRHPISFPRIGSLRSLYCAKWKPSRNLGPMLSPYPMATYLEPGARALRLATARAYSPPVNWSLVRITHKGDQQELRGRDARLLFHALLSRHRCVVSVDLGDAMVEGCGLRECRDRVILTLRQNTSLRSLSLLSIFNDYRFIQEDLFGAIGAATQLQRLEIIATGEVVPCLADSICSLLCTASVSTLSISALFFDERTAERLLDALRANTTVVDLALHSSVLRCRNSADVPKFCSYLASKASLWHLALDAMDSRPVQTRNDIAAVLAVLAESGNLQTLKLSGFLLDGTCARAVSRLMARHDAPLRQLDLAGCIWTMDDSPNSADAATDYDQPRTSTPEPTQAWLGPFDDFTKLTLSSLSINLEGWKPNDYTALFYSAAVIESFKTIMVTGVSLSELPQVCRVIRKAGVGEKVHIKSEYLLNSVRLGLLDECREHTSHIVLCCRSDPSVDSFRKSVQLMSSWHHLTTLRLFLSKETLGDFSTMWSLCSYINAATRLRELELTGRDNARLYNCPTAENCSHSRLLDVVFSNEGLRAVRIRRISFGKVNLRFLVHAVFSNQTLRELDVSSRSSWENEELLRLLAADFESNRTLLRFRLPNCAGDYREARRRANMEAIVSRNVGYVTCAAHYVAWETDPRRCVVALSCIPKSRALIDKVKELSHLDEAEAEQIDFISAVLAIFYYSLAKFGNGR
ncbi:hypothetical protein MTO96_028924 [Rhipicephalus appendiculatus]